SPPAGSCAVCAPVLPGRPASPAAPPPARPPERLRTPRPLPASPWVLRLFQHSSARTARPAAPRGAPCCDVGERLGAATDIGRAGCAAARHGGTNGRPYEQRSGPSLPSRRVVPRPAALAFLFSGPPKDQVSDAPDDASGGATVLQHHFPYRIGRVPAMPPTERIRDHAGQGATTVAAHRARRRLRADRARRLADLLRHQILAGGFPT